MKKSKMLFLVCTAAGAMMLSACSLPNSNENTTIAVDDTGKVTETIVEACEDGAFTEEELQDYIDDTISSYAASSGKKDAVSLSSCEVSGTGARVVMTFASVDDYSQFNQVPCFLGTIQEASDAGYDVNQVYMDPAGTTGDNDTIMERKNEWKVFVVSEPVYVRVPDKILYATSNVSITGRMTANVQTVIKAEENTSDSAETAAEDTNSVEAVSSDSEPSAEKQTERETEQNTVDSFATVADEYAYIIYK